MIIIPPRPTIINKTIVYSDTVLPLKDKGESLKVTSIEGVSEYSLENCLKVIFESNPDVIFNTIQYSRKDKKVYFYTNKAITTKIYEESKFRNFKSLTSKTEILEEVKKVLLSPKNKDHDCISLYNVLILLRKLNEEYNATKEKYENKLANITENKMGKDSSLYCRDIDFENKTMHISFKKYKFNDYNEIYLAKQNDDLYVSKSSSIYTAEVFSVLCSTLSEMYDELSKYADFINYKYIKYDKKAVNSNFNIKISYCGIWLSIKNFPNESMKMELFAPSYSNNYKLNCNSSVVSEAFNGKEIEIFKRIFVKISDCPEWSQTILYETRQNELIEEQKIEDKTKNKEMKKEKRLALTRKIFPFLKK